MKRGLGRRSALCIALLAGACLPLNSAFEQPAPGTAGVLEVSYLYMPPTTIDPTYHTAMWLEDDKGQLVKTLYVSQELSSAEFKMGNVCPDWVKLAHWETAPKAEIDAVTAPTPNVGSEAKVFDLAALGIPPGVYRFKFQMHVGEDHNVLFQGTLNAGAGAETLKLEKTEGPGKPLVPDQYVRDVEARYLAPAK